MLPRTANGVIRDPGRSNDSICGFPVPRLCVKTSAVNLPNKLTVGRLALTGVFLGAMFSQSAPLNNTVALFLFVAASITDYLDGKIARERNLITSFGKLMDPLAGKILTCSAFIALVERGMQFGWEGTRVHAWMAVIIVPRELAITGLRLLAASKNVVLAAERYGKHKTISQIVAIIALLVAEARGEWPAWLSNIFNGWGPPFVQLSLYVTVGLTLISGAIYLWKNREVYLNDM